MTQEEYLPFARAWKEFWGRRKVMEPIPFTETSIMTLPTTFRIKTHGHYLLLPSLAAAIITSPTGHKQVFTEGGYKELQEGAYTIQYVDLSERYINLPRITAATRQGSDVSLTVSLNYKIYDPTQIITVAEPLKTLLSVCEAALKNFIITHRHEELISELGSDQFVSDNEIIQYIKEQVAMNQSCRAFWVMNVIIKERYGNPEIGNLKHKDLVQEKRSLTELHRVIQQQGIAEEHKVVATKEAEENQIVKELQSLTEANQSEILKHARLLEIELEGMRKTIDTKQEQALKMIDVKQEALKTLLHLNQISGFPRDGNELKLMEKILDSLSETQISTPELPSERSQSANELSKTIINLITPKRRDQEQSE